MKQREKGTMPALVDPSIFFFWHVTVTSVKSFAA
jgi:hypothetical protein